MTKDEALLLAVANARGLVSLTRTETVEVDLTLARAADELRRTLATEKVAIAQRRIAAANPSSPCGLEADADDLKLALEHQSEVAEKTRADHYLHPRARARGAMPYPTDVGAPVSQADVS